MSSSSFTHLLLTPSFNRGYLLQPICDKLAVDAAASNLRVIHAIVDDGSTLHQDSYKAIHTTYRNGGADSTPYQVVMVRNEVNNGSKGFWKTLNKLFEFTLSTHYQYVVALPDDCMPCDSFLSRVTSHLLRLQEQDPSICAMNTGCALLRNWGTSRYIDGAYIADRRLFQALDFRLFEPIGEWSDNFKAGSGTGFQMTKRIGESGVVRIAPCQDVSYLAPIDTPSVMFRRGKGEMRWWRNNFVDPKGGG